MYKLIYKNDVGTEYDNIQEFIEEYEEECGTLTEEQKWNMACDNIESWLEDEKLNLSDIAQNGVVTIVSLQLWNRVKFGFLFSDNLSEALSHLPIDDDCTFEWGVNGRDMIGRLWHHDDPMGNTTMIVRQLKDGVDFDKINEKNWRRLTKSVKKPICEVYGW